MPILCFGFLTYFETQVFSGLRELSLIFFPHPDCFHLFPITLRVYMLHFPVSCPNVSCPLSQRISGFRFSFLVLFALVQICIIFLMFFSEEYSSHLLSEGDFFFKFKKNKTILTLQTGQREPKLTRSPGSKHLNEQVEQVYYRVKEPAKDLSSPGPKYFFSFVFYWMQSPVA